MFFSFTLRPPYASLIKEDAVQICFAILRALSVGLKHSSIASAQVFKTPNLSLRITPFFVRFIPKMCYV